MKSYQCERNHHEKKRRAELISVLEVSIEEEDQIKGRGNPKNEKAVDQLSKDSKMESMGS